MFGFISGYDPNPPRVKRNKGMNYSNAIFLISDDVRCIGAIYNPDEEHKVTHFKTLDQDVKVDDYVLVASTTRHKMTTCKVVSVDLDVDFDSEEEIKWVIGKIELADFNDLKRQEDLAITKIKSAEKRRKREELKKALIADAEDDIKAIPIFADKTPVVEPAPVRPAPPKPDMDF